MLPVHPVDAGNLEFYELVAERFSRTRSRPWKGWEKLELPDPGPVRVLDAGCGNGRLYDFLSERCAGPLDYVGVDFSPALLRIARCRVAAQKRRTDRVEFHEIDLLRPDPPSLGTFQRIYLFGVLHHVAERLRRQALLKALRKCLTPGGQIWLTVWQFDTDPRYRAALERGMGAEPGAALLPFDGLGQRYCVSVPEEEIDAYPGACGLVERRRFCADGRSGRMNLYLVYNRANDGEAG